ncbi:hypothetical protein PCC8801_4049 [Rippkaea orientalis PCC 8801]|uniref:L,D-TPase catalytic domain-containing protein n=1 Tax=Rippkaea orientalis (strain PCC 8801 / RF-1) TaxID=41431 RepID=B7K5T3_RIPO1|nr:L,D-transpeptidase [Rippkaea orientalis]ACK67986.1 hypothetical protein PCC8801_4049 [Rippkaea orientalis PCC 8801]
MLLKITLSLLGCVGVFVYISQTQPKSSPSFDQQLELNHVQGNFESKPSLNIKNLSTQKQQQWQDFQETQKTPLKTPLSLTQETVTQEITSSQPKSPEPIEPVAINNYMTLTATEKTNQLGNPIYHLQLYAKGQLIGVYPTVTGKAKTQGKNRHQAGSKAPLPNGRYSVASTPVAGTDPEVGQLFLPIEPQFATGRTALGIHYDPSFEKSNGEDGTEGCIALTDESQLQQVLLYVQTYQPEYLEVNLPF